ncbi:phage tail sheath family protein [Aureimonas sp. SK2]|uniref:phage tail sheath family protein n=1 Tax=Aureimonas sp. SK2 TaxID=3015992 RepID=UPI0024449173|nr:phage tail sheath family protein [Aureimonas sp. SK2]
MSNTTDHVGVRVFSDLRNTTVALDVRDSTAIGMSLPLPNIAAGNEAAFPVGQCVRLSMDDPVQLAKLGPGIAYDTVRTMLMEGIVTDIAFVRAATKSDPEEQLGAVAGDAALRTGVWGLLNAKADIGIEPGIIIEPGFTSQRPGNAKNPVALAMSAVSDIIIDCLGIVDTPDTNREAAAAYASDFAAVYNLVAMYPKAQVFLDGSYVTRPASPIVAAMTVKRDKAVGNPYKAAWNRASLALGGLSQRVTYHDGRTDGDANFLNFRGVGTFIENNLLWAPFTTATDPTTVGYRSIKRIRTRRAIEKSFIRQLRAYNSEDLGPHLVTLLFRTLDEALAAPQSVGAIIQGSEVIFDRKLNQDGSLRKGALKLKLRFEETPDLIDLGLYTEPQPEAYDVLTGQIRTAIESLGSPNLRFVA